LRVDFLVKICYKASVMRNNVQPPKHLSQGTTGPAEVIKDLGRDLVDGVTKNFVGGIASDAFRQVMGPAGENGQEQGRILPRREQLRPLLSVKERALYVEENKREIAYKADLILTEIRELARETEGLEKQLGGFVLEETPQDPGEYHLSFWGRILKLIEKARQSIHDATTCLAIWNGRGQKRGLLAGYGFGYGRKSSTAGIHKMLGEEMGIARSGA
jgi:hypothetical protein